MSLTTIRPALLGACLLATFVVAATSSSGSSQVPDVGMLGFAPARVAAQQSLEQRFDAQLDPADQRAWLQQMSSQPNQVGSPHDKANAEFILKKFREWGWDAHIETFSVLYPTPKQTALELLGPKPYTATLKEPPVAGDATSSLPGVLPPYVIYGGDGDVTAELVYANYGMPDDYKELARRGIDVRGKIVITRYGGGWRGLKPKLAQEHGAVGCLIYSDPHDDGYARGDVYPQGGWRPPEGVQRGSVMDMQLYPGDPLTPGIGATANAKRLAIKDAKTILKIPVLPISYADATPLLAALTGPVAPASWRGALPITYHVGPSQAKAHLTVLSNWEQKPLYDVIAKIKGASAPDQWIVRGNHHDGWVFGASDPLAGSAAMLAEAKAIGGLLKQGWRPQRTLVYASWDGEEPMLLGSTEWAETHAAELKKKGVLYVNTDVTGRGFLGAQGSHSLQHLVNQVAAGVTDPQTHGSVLERARACTLLASDSENAWPGAKANAKLVAAGGELPIGALGSGSDYSAFLDHLGLATLDIGFGGENANGGVYHSRYDSFDHYVRFGDPTFEYGVALSKVVGHVVLRVADADVLPLRFSDFSDTLGRYVGELHQLVAATHKATVQQHQLLDLHAYTLASDPTSPVAPPARDSDVPDIDLKPLDRVVAALDASVRAYQAAYSARATMNFSMPKARLQQINSEMGRMEQALTNPAGLPGRPWYKHMIYAPGVLTGYGAKTLPAVREAVEGRRWNEADQYAVVTAKVIDGYRARLDALTVLLENPGK